MIKLAGLLDIDEMAWTGAFWRAGDRRAPHNLYTGTGRLRQAGDASYPFQQASASPFEFLTEAKVEKMTTERDKEKERAARAASQQASQPGEEAGRSPQDRRSPPPTSIRASPMSTTWSSPTSRSAW